MRHALVTGATGFIGSNLSRSLISQGVKVTALVRSADGLPDDLRDCVHVLHGSLADLPKTDLGGEDIDVVFHLAANASVKGGEREYHLNVDGTKALIEACRKLPNLSRIVYCSSIGAVDRLPEDRCSEPLTEDSEPNPLTIYGRSKLEGEKLIIDSGLNFSIVRPTWVYGPGMRANSHISTFAAMARKGHLLTKIALPGKVSLIHVDDLVALLLRAATHPACQSQIIFASDGHPVSIGELFKELRGLYGRCTFLLPVPRALVELLRKVRSRLPFSLQVLLFDVLSASDAKSKAIGFTPQIRRKQGLAETARSLGSGKGSRVLITGGAGGIGAALAEQFWLAGYELLLVDKDAAGLARVAAQFDGLCYSLDISNRSALLRIDEILQEKRPDVVINCAGIGVRGPVEDLESSRQLDVINVNVSALVHITTVATKFFRSRKQGYIINIASSAAFQPLPFMATYAASKSAVLSFGRAVAQELRSSPIRILTVCPGGTNTGFQASSGVKKSASEKLDEPSHVASQIFRAMEDGRSLLILGKRSLAMALAARLLPYRVQDRLWSHLMRKMR